MNLTIYWAASASAGSISDTKKGSGSWKLAVRTHIFSPCTLWTVKPREALLNKCQLGLSAGPERTDVSWGQPGRHPQRGWRTLPALILMGLGRGPCQVAQLPHRFGVHGNGKCSSSKEATEQPAQERDVILTPCAIKPDQYSTGLCVTWREKPFISPAFYRWISPA